MDASRFAGSATTTGADAGQLFHDQVGIADVLIGSKADLCDAPTLERFEAWAAQLYPRKQRVATCANGQLEPEWLGIPHRSSSSSKNSSGQSSPSSCLPPSDSGPLRKGRTEPWLTNSAAAAGAVDGQPVRKVASSASEGTVACGWVFSEGDSFCRERLEGWLCALLACTQLLRLKGVFRVGPETWVAANNVAAGRSTAGAAAPAAREVELRATAYRGASRVEIIVSAGGGQESSSGGRNATVGGGGEQEAPPAFHRQQEGGKAAVTAAAAALAGPAAEATTPAATAAAALRQGIAGDWSQLQQLLVQCTQLEMT